MKAVSSALAMLYERRWLVWYFVQRQLFQSYRGSFLGILWVFLGPLLLVILYTLVFSEIIGLRFKETGGVTNFGLYVYCGLVPFQAYAETMNKSVSSIRQNSNLVKRAVFPLEILPFSTAATSVLNQVFGFGALVVLVALLERQLHWTALLLPLVMIPQLLFNMGLGFLGALAGTYLPDVREILTALVRASFFATPIIWPPDQVPERFSFLVDYNPVALLVGAYRSLILEGRLPEGMQVLWFTLFAAVLCAVGFVIFARAKQQFADLI